MKQSIGVLVLAFILFGLMSNSGGRGLVGGPATTAPGENGQFCGSTGCHSSGTFSPKLSIIVNDATGQIVSEYIPGEDYTVSVVINHNGFPSRYGFQIVSLRDGNNAAINNFNDIPDFAHDVVLLGRQYVEHDMPLPFDSIPLSWVAPDNGTGDVAFYAAGNAVNGNGNPTGDGADKTMIILPEALNASVSAEDPLSFSIYPNPSDGIVHVITQNNFQLLQIFDPTSKMVFTTTEQILDISDLNPGMYYMKMTDKTGSNYKIEKLFKY